MPSVIAFEQWFKFSNTENGGNNVLSRELAMHHFPQFYNLKKKQTLYLYQKPYIHSKFCIKYRKVSKDDNKDCFSLKWKMFKKFPQNILLKSVLSALSK